MPRTRSIAAAPGLALAVIVGAVLGIAMATWRPLDLMAGPLVELFYPMPKSALIPVTALWLGFGDGSKILLIFLGCMLPVTLGGYNGARGADRVLLWSARSMGASRLRTLLDVVLPSALPELANGVRTALALSFILLVSSELIAARQGLGFLIGSLGADGSYEAMFAVVLTVAALGFLADRLYMARSTARCGGGNDAGRRHAPGGHACARAGGADPRARCGVGRSSRAAAR